METFLVAFVFLLLAVAGMAVGVAVSGRTIKGSCGGLNAVSGADRCLICKKEVDPNSPLRDRIECPRARRASS